VAAPARGEAEEVDGDGVIAAVDPARGSEAGAVVVEGAVVSAEVLPADAVASGAVVVGVVVTPAVAPVPVPLPLLRPPTSGQTKW
jgi:hypothetical protein